MLTGREWGVPAPLRQDRGPPQEHREPAYVSLLTYRYFRSGCPSGREVRERMGVEEDRSGSQRHGSLRARAPKGQEPQKVGDAEFAAGLQNGVHMFKDDFEAEVSDFTYWMNFAGGNPARCNEKTAPPECTSALLEELP